MLPFSSLDNASVIKHCGAPLHVGMFRPSRLWRQFQPSLTVTSIVDSRRRPRPEFRDGRSWNIRYRQKKKYPYGCHHSEECGLRKVVNHTDHEICQPKTGG